MTDLGGAELRYSREIPDADGIISAARDNDGASRHHPHGHTAYFPCVPADCVADGCACELVPDAHGHVMTA